MGARIREAREAKGITQTALAKKAGITREYVNKIEAGRHDPTVGKLDRIARALAVPMSLTILGE